MNKIFVCLAFLILGHKAAYSQSYTNLKWVLMVQLKPNTQPKIVREQLGIAGSQWNCIDSAFRIYTIQCANEEKAAICFQQLKVCNKLQFYQHVGEVKNRGVNPNDPLYGQQKYIGLSGINQLWPYMRGGTNRRGDTLVVAIIDSGVDTLQPDLLANRWVNRQEIPDNVIDDDNNGYVDDYLGWNGGDNNHRTFTKVSQDGHGTAIAGIIGAAGNNQTGITGINWNIKIMPLVCYAEQGTGSDIGVVRSMIYAFKMKQLFLRTQGAKGANIAAVNTSIGMDLAFPEDAPIWCSLYDSLGSVGIISSAATGNNDIDVGVKGDIPSTCPSKFMVVVTATKFTDERMSSGYSTKYVDMAAMGENIYTTLLVKNAGVDGPYGSHSGTSFAAPQIAGTIALLYQHACDTFLHLMEHYPDSASKIAMDWVLKGVDLVPALNTKCFTGGRLNAYKAWQQMDIWCTSKDRTYANKQHTESDGLFYPNPVAQNGLLHFVAPGSSGKGNLEIFSAEGKKVLQTLVEGEKEFEISLNGVPAGIYFVHFNIANQRLVRKLLIY